jgi:hypothetical protein
MNNNKHHISNAMKLNGGFELSDREIAELELKETQLKLSGRYIPPSERADVISRKDAEDRLRGTLGATEEAPSMTKEEALAQLAETQRKLATKHF